LVPNTFTSFLKTQTSPSPPLCRLALGTSMQQSGPSLLMVVAIPNRWLSLLLLAANVHDHVCCAERVGYSSLSQPPTVGKQPLSKTVAKMFKIEGTSVTETAAGAGSCQSRNIWTKTNPKPLGNGDHAEVFEVAKYDAENHRWIGKYAMKVALNDNENKEVVAEATLLESIHDNYKKAGKGELCPNVVPVYDKEPCLYDPSTKQTHTTPGAYISKKFEGDLENWLDEHDMKQCRGRQGKDVYREQLLRGLNCAHQYGHVAHTDIKADNYLYNKLSSDDGCPDQIYLADFGLAEELGEVTTFFGENGLRESQHRVTDIIKGGADNLNIRVFKDFMYKVVFEDYESNEKIKEKDRKTAKRGLRRVDYPTSRLVDDKADLVENTQAVGYKVSELIDYCGLIMMCNTDFGWRMPIPGYTTKESLNCGGMGRGRERVYTGADR